MRLAEEQGEPEEAATRLVRNNLEAHTLLPSEAPVEISPARTPVAHRLGPISETQSPFERLGPRVQTREEERLPQSLQQVQKRKGGQTVSKTYNPFVPRTDQCRNA